ncbi:unnamed protein product, partial [Iphiclides podalirius]
MRVNKFNHHYAGIDEISAKGHTGQPVSAGRVASRSPRVEHEIPVRAATNNGTAPRAGMRRYALHLHLGEIVNLHLGAAARGGYLPPLSGASVPPARMTPKGCRCRRAVNVIYGPGPPDYCRGPAPRRLICMEIYRRAVASRFQRPDALVPSTARTEFITHSMRRRQAVSSVASSQIPNSIWPKGCQLRGTRKKLRARVGGEGVSLKDMSGGGDVSSRVRFSLRGGN